MDYDPMYAVAQLVVGVIVPIATIWLVYRLLSGAVASAVQGAVFV